MEVLTPKATRRSTRLRVEIPVNVTSLDRMRPFAETCVVLVVSAQGCGFRSSRPLQLETPVLLSDLPGGRSVTARVANCLPLGGDGSYLIGAALYTHGNVWGIADPPDDWEIAAKSTPVPPDNASPENAPEAKINKVKTNKNKNRKEWPYNLFSDSTETHRGRK
jgi:hypothetical protein